jgi:hypothetical protein
MVHAVVELGEEIHAAIGMGGKVLDIVAEDLGIAHEGEHVVEGGDVRHEEADLVHRPHDAPRRDEVADLEGAKDEEEDAGGQVGEEAAPRAPMAMPTPARRAAKLVVSMPKKPRRAMMRVMVRMTDSAVPI